MSLKPNEIEISIPITINAGLAFAVDRDAWRAASEEERREMREAPLERAARHLNDRIMDVIDGVDDEPRCFLSMSMIGPDAADINLARDVHVYDPGPDSAD